GLHGTALSMAINLHGGDPFNTNIHIMELLEPEERDNLKFKDRILFNYENITNLMNCLLICNKLITVLDWDMIEKLYSIVFNLQFPKRSLEEACNRIITTIRHFNLREGLSYVDDFLPDLFFNQPLPRGKSKGLVVNKNEYVTELKKYYRLRGFDEYGVPLKKSELDGERVTYYF
ncbi:MAG: aldehyde ferredoxin oxidoreductase C-terminal domain-containing protein, partial [Candidatus Odinarchaeia archaeon]